MKICENIVKAGGHPYIVGGWVRDTLLGLRPKDVDLVVVGFNNLVHAEEKLNEALGEIKLVGNSFPVFISGDGTEIALARRERKIGDGHAGFSCDISSVSLEDDLFRRDLTINAIAYDPLEGRYIDPFNGIKDLQAKILRPVSEAFKEDPLRVLRAARFAAQFDMTVSDELVLMCLDKGIQHELRTLTGERVFAELQKALRADRPSRFFWALDLFGALGPVFPELAALKGRIQPEKHHPEGCVLTHTLLVIDRARELGAGDEAMLAALLHDLGKAVTPDDDLPRHINHEVLGVPLVHQFCNRFKVANHMRDAAVAAAREHLNIHKFLELRPTTKVRLLDRLGAAHNDTLLRIVCLAAQADAQGRGPLFHDKAYPQHDAVLDAANKFRTVKGNQFAHLKDGNKIRQKMEEARAKLLK